MSELDLMNPKALPPSEDAASWLHDLTRAERVRHASREGGLALVLCLCLGAIQWAEEVVNPVAMFWTLVIALMGAWRVGHWTMCGPVRRYRSTTTVLTRAQRWRKARPLLVTGLGAPPVIWVLQGLAGNGALQAYWTVGLLFMPLALLGLLVFAFVRSETRLTPEAAAMKAHDARVEEQRKQALSGKVDAFFGTLLNLPFVRYPLSVVLFWFAFHFPPDSRVGLRCFLILVVVGLAMWCAREIFKWILGIGLVVGLCWALFRGIAALPVSVAILIGALIIGSKGKG
jgi:hypothetical protein